MANQIIQQLHPFNLTYSLQIGLFEELAKRSWLVRL